jgi:hypothetical protein
MLYVMLTVSAAGCLPESLGYVGMDREVDLTLRPTFMRRCLTPFIDRSMSIATVQCIKEEEETAANAEGIEETE